MNKKKFIKAICFCSFIVCASNINNCIYAAAAKEEQNPMADSFTLMKTGPFYEQHLDPQLKAWINQNKSTPGIKYFKLNDRNYVLLSKGRKPTSGYSLKIDSFEEKEDHINVYVKSITPDPMQIVLMAMCDVYILAEIKKPVSFHLDSMKLGE